MIFVVIEGHGQYSDRYEQPIAAFKNEADAKSYVEWTVQHKKDRFLRFVSGNDDVRAEILAEIELPLEAAHEHITRNRQAGRSEYEIAMTLFGDGTNVDYEIEGVPFYETFPS